MFYEQFIELCSRNNVKPTPLIKSLGLSPGNIKRWEMGATVNSDILLKLSECFHVSIDYLLTGKEKSQSSELPEDKQRLLAYYALMTDREQGEILGDMKNLTKGRADEFLQDVG